MPRYIYRSTNKENVLIWGGKEHRDGDSITIPKADAKNLALQSRRHRFEATGDGQDVDMASIETATASPKDTSAKS